MNTSISLFDISTLAKTEPKKAARYIQNFATKKFNLALSGVVINNSAVSLNSVNGFLLLKTGEEYFFKFHAEEGEGETVGEYYRAGILEKAGFPVVTPLFQSTTPEQQFLVYPKISAPTFFDICEEMDEDFFKTGKYDMKKRKQMMDAERKINTICLDKAKKTLRFSDAKTIAFEPIWQLFFHRLVSQKKGITPRLDLFYTGKIITFSREEEISFEALAQMKWEINGRKYDESLAEIIRSAKAILNPFSQKKWATITAHGDDHNGNKFFCDDGRTAKGKYFDPAFAGETVPALLAFVKTIFHDTFAHPFWMYESERISDTLKISYTKKGNTLFVTHNFDLEKVAPIRVDLLREKINSLLRPLILELKTKNILPPNAKNIFKKALFCCPFLTINLIDHKRFSPQASLLALSRAVEMGTKADRNLIDEILGDMI